MEYFSTLFGRAPSPLLKVVELPKDTVPTAWAPEIAALSTGNIGEKICRLLQLFNCFGEVNNVDGIPLLENERLHFRIPSLRLVSKVNSCFEKFGH